MSTDQEVLLRASEVEEIELYVRKRVLNLTLGEHKSVFKSTSGHDFTGIREKLPSDLRRHIDWPHSVSSSTPSLKVREFEEERSVDVWIIPDNSLSTRCGTQGMAIAKIIARAIATVGFSAVLMQDRVAMVLGDGERFYTLEPRGGKGGVHQIVHKYSNTVARSPVQFSTVLQKARALMRGMSFVVFVSDFLFPKEEIEEVVSELARIGTSHDVVLFVVDASFAFALPKPRDGWVRCRDIERNTDVVVSSKEFAELPQRCRKYEEDVVRRARETGLDALLLRGEPHLLEHDLLVFFLERRMRRD